jgi:hypothetical protein
MDYYLNANTDSQLAEVADMFGAIAAVIISLAGLRSSARAKAAV